MFDNLLFEEIGVHPVLRTGILVPLAVVTKRGAVVGRSSDMLDLSLLMCVDAPLLRTQE